jgi:hypothetical protein
MWEMNGDWRLCPISTDALISERFLLEDLRAPKQASAFLASLSIFLFQQRLVTDISSCGQSACNCTSVRESLACVWQGIQDGMGSRSVALQDKIHCIW